MIEEDFVKVYLRLRPIGSEEKVVWNYDPGCIYQDVEQIYSFDHVFGP